eukprot:6174655-Pleurochrysis_carterae.AAC.3
MARGLRMACHGQCRRGGMQLFSQLLLATPASGLALSRLSAQSHASCQPPQRIRQSTELATLVSSRAQCNGVRSANHIAMYSQCAQRMRDIPAVMVFRCKPPFRAGSIVGCAPPPVHKYYLRVRGLPWSKCRSEAETSEAIAPLLPEPCGITRVAIGRDRRGRSTGMVGLELQLTRPDALLAQHVVNGLHGKYIGTRWLDVELMSQGQWVHMYQEGEAARLAIASLAAGQQELRRLFACPPC